MSGLLTDLREKLPERLGQWSNEIAAAAVKTVPRGVPVQCWAAWIAAVMDRESGGGELLTPKGAAGTGDRGHGRGLMQLDDRDLTRPEDPPFQRAFAQKRLAMVKDGTWRLADRNVLAGASYLRDLYHHFNGAVPLMLAGYNASLSRVQAAVAGHELALDVVALVDEVTYGGDYVSDVLGRAARWS